MYKFIYIIYSYKIYNVYIHIQIHMYYIYINIYFIIASNYLL